MIAYDQADEATREAFWQFKDGCGAVAEGVYEKLLSGLGGLEGIGRQRAIRKRIRDMRAILRQTPGMAALDVAEWLSDGLEKAAQERDDLP